VAVTSYDIAVRGHLVGNTLSIFRMILSADCTAEATSDSVRGLGRESNRSSVFLKMTGNEDTGHDCQHSFYSIKGVVSRCVRYRK
jgi:hypothetical protein